MKPLSLGLQNNEAVKLQSLASNRHRQTLDVIGHVGQEKSNKQEVYIFQNHAAYNGGGPMMGYCPGASLSLCQLHVTPKARNISIAGIPARK